MWIGRGKFSVLLLHIFSILLLRTHISNGTTVTNIRLNNGTSNPTPASGRLEVQINNQPLWGGVCDDQFGKEDAIVACRMLGFRDGDAQLNTTLGAIGLGNNFLVDDLKCNGDETNLTKCMSSLNPNCDARGSDTFVGVVCNNDITATTRQPPTTKNPIPLPNNCRAGGQKVQLWGTVEGIGYVQVQNPNTFQWGYICDDKWSQRNARVVCQELCYNQTEFPGLPGMPSELRVTPSNPNIILDDVNCEGTEASVVDCPKRAFGNDNCLDGTGELASVQCVPHVNIATQPPVPILQCMNGMLIARFSRSKDPNLEEKDLSVWNAPSCNVTKNKTDTTVNIYIPASQCGTIISNNATHITYENSVKYDSTSQEGPITRANVYKVELDCSYLRNDTVNTGIQPMGETVTVASEGKFKLQMAVYENDQWDTPSTPNDGQYIQIPLGDYINVAVILEDNKDGVKLVLEDCIATPNQFVNTATNKPLFLNKCSQEESLSFYPISNYKLGFRFRSFKFVGNNLLFIHCNSIICKENDQNPECDRSCNSTKVENGRRRRRSALFQTVVSTVSFTIYDPFARDPEPEVDKEEIKIVISGNRPTSPRPKTMTTGTTTTKLSSMSRSKSTTSTSTIKPAEHLLSSLTPDASKSSKSENRLLFVEAGAVPSKPLYTYVIACFICLKFLVI